MPIYREVARTALKLHLNSREAFWGASIVAASSMLAVWGEPYLGQVTAALVFVLGVTIVGALYGLAAALIGAFIAFVIYNFFLAEPFLSFRMANSQDAGPLIAFNVAALIAGVLAGRLQDRAQAVQRANLQLASLLETSQELQSALRPDEVVDKLTTSTPARLGLMLRVFRPTGVGFVEMGGPSEARWSQVAQATWESGSLVYQDAELTGFMLTGSRNPIGVLVVGNSGGWSLDPAFLAALASLLALALERAELSEDLTETQALARSEELKTALLSSVSHDFRTPLTAISASASSLVDYGEQLPPDTRLRLLRGIVEEGERLNRYTANLLELSKLQAGTPVQNAQVVDVVDIVGGAIQRVRPRLGERSIERRLPRETLLVRTDPALFELVLVNVLDNSINYSDDESRIEIAVRYDGAQVAVDVSDEGSGIPLEELDRVFERFYRVKRAETTSRGSGLGLAIARGFVEAFDGRIWAEVPGLGKKGTRIAIRLPAIQTN